MPAGERDWDYTHTAQDQHPDFPKKQDQYLGLNTENVAEELETLRRTVWRTEWRTRCPIYWSST